MERGAKVFVCGSREVGEEVKRTALRICVEEAKKKGRDGDEVKAARWFDSIRNEWYATGVFG